MSQDSSTEFLPTHASLSQHGDPFRSTEEEKLTPSKSLASRSPSPVKPRRKKLLSLSSRSSAHPSQTTNGPASQLEHNPVDYAQDLLQILDRLQQAVCLRAQTERGSESGEMTTPPPQPADNVPFLCAISRVRDLVHAIHQRHKEEDIFQAMQASETATLKSLLNSGFLARGSLVTGKQMLHQIHARIKEASNLSASISLHEAENLSLQIQHLRNELHQTIHCAFDQFAQSLDDMSPDCVHMSLPRFVQEMLQTQQGSFETRLRRLLHAPESIQNYNFPVISSQPDFDRLETILNGQWGSYRLFERWITETSRWVWFDLKAQEALHASKIQTEQLIQKKRDSYLELLDHRLAQLWLSQSEELKRECILDLHTLMSEHLQLKHPQYMTMKITFYERQKMAYEDLTSHLQRLCLSPAGLKFFKVSRGELKQKAVSRLHSWKALENCQQELTRLEKMLITNPGLLESLQFQTSADHIVESIAQTTSQLKRLQKSNDAAEKQSTKTMEKLAAKQTALIAALKKEEEKANQLLEDQQDLTALQQRVQELQSAIDKASAHVKELEERKRLKKELQHQVASYEKQLKDKQHAETKLMARIGSDLAQVSKDHSDSFHATSHPKKKSLFRKLGHALSTHPTKSPQKLKRTCSDLSPSLAATMAESERDIHPRRSVDIDLDGNVFVQPTSNCGGVKPSTMSQTPEVVAKSAQTPPHVQLQSNLTDREFVSFQDDMSVTPQLNASEHSSQDDHPVKQQPVPHTSDELHHLVHVSPLESASGVHHGESVSFNGEKVPVRDTLSQPDPTWSSSGHSEKSDINPADLNSKDKCATLKQHKKKSFMKQLKSVFKHSSKPSRSTRHASILSSGSEANESGSLTSVQSEPPSSNLPPIDVSPPQSQEQTETDPNHVHPKSKSPPGQLSSSGPPPASPVPVKPSDTQRYTINILKSLSSSMSAHQPVSRGYSGQHIYWYLSETLLPRDCDTLFAEEFTPQQLHSGQILFEEGDPVLTLYQIHEGSVLLRNTATEFVLSNHEFVMWDAFQSGGEAEYTATVHSKILECSYVLHENFSQAIADRRNQIKARLRAALQTQIPSTQDQMDELVDSYKLISYPCHDDVIYMKGQDAHCVYVVMEGACYAAEGDSTVHEPGSCLGLEACMQSPTTYRDTLLACSSDTTVAQLRWS